LTTIPASTIVNVVPSVIGAGGTGLNGTGLMLSYNSRIPSGTILSFQDDLAVEDYFGVGSFEAAEAADYFAGFNGATISPSTLMMARFNQISIPAFLRGGDIAGLTLAQLQSISGSLDILIDGVAHNAASVNLSAVTSFSNAAATIATALNGSLANLFTGTGAIAAETADFTASIAGLTMTVTTVASGKIVEGGALAGSGVTSGTLVGAQLSGTPGGIGIYAVSISQIVASEALTETYGELTVTAVSSGALAVGQTLGGATVEAGTIITALGTGTGGDGTYFVNLTQTIASEAITSTGTAATVAFDSVSGAFVTTSGIVGAASTMAYATGTAAAALMLTSATGAVISQGAEAQSPSTFMSALIIQNSSWVNFMTLMDPDHGSGNAIKQEFAAWKDTALGGNRFGYFCWDPDDSPATQSDAAASLGQILKANGDSGTLLIWEGGQTEDSGLCAFALGWAASVNYAQTNGRATLDFRAQAGIVANVTDPLTSGNLDSNGYNYYAAIGAGNANFIWFQTGQITGEYAWADSYQTQIWLNSFFTVQLLTLFQNVLRVPFSSAGITLIEETCQTVIQQGLAFGAFGPDTLTPGQIAEINNQAGANVASVLQSQGYYLQVLLPEQEIQAARGPWPITFWYIDQGAVQKIDMSSIAVQ
jgi:hypothetical protein